MLNLQNTFANPAFIADSGYQAPQRFLIMGLGESGVAMAKWCLRNRASVRFVDTRDQSQFSDRQHAWLEELKTAGLKDIRFGSFSDELLIDIEKQTVDFVPNYDESEFEPSVLPTRIPNLLINGSSGIAVGMATSIPPHNLNEVIDAMVALIDNPALTIDVSTITFMYVHQDLISLILGSHGVYSRSGLPDRR